MEISDLPFRIIVIGASAGGLDAISEIVGGLPAGFPVPILYVSHMPIDYESALPAILKHRTDLNVAEASDGLELQPGCLYLSVSGHDVTVEHGSLRVTAARKDAKFCPSINAAISSAARAYGENMIAVLLTGRLDDGVEGLQENHRQGGFTIVQTPSDAAFPSMPSEAVLRDHPDSILPLSKIAERLVVLTFGNKTPGRAEEIRVEELEADEAKKDR